MPFGRFGSFPFRLGGGKPLARSIYEGLNSSLGTAYDTSEESTVTAETAAEARLIAFAWRANERAALQKDPTRVSEFLARWEAIFGLRPSPLATFSERRAAVVAKWTALADPDPQGLQALCVAVLGDYFVAVEWCPLSRAMQHWPGGGEPGTWYSSTAHVLIRVTQPVGTTDGTFLARMNVLMALLDDFLPDEVRFDWGIYNSDGVAGFLLDDDHNLDWETFD